jgi:peptidoglycan hydrolase-like amidase
LRAQVDKEAEFFRVEVGKARAFQNQLNIEIAKLTARQQEILAAKFGTFTTSVGDVPLADDFNASPAFNPGFSPAFAAFSFGAYTHRNGMSQYGALGRANTGQNAEQILQAYYPGANLNKNYAVPATIDVVGFGTMPFEDQYLKRIYEVPNSWPLEVLKAQAVAARTFAIRSNKPICTTQACQVYQNSNKGGRWEEAVNATRGWVLEGGPGAQYSSTSGGYLNTSGWDTNCGSFSCWTGGAYEKIAGSPWFYKAWYTESYLNSSNKCGRSHPWLTNDEFTDILNSWVVYKNGTQAEKDRIVPTSCWSGNPFSISEMRDRANAYGGAYTSASSISVSQGTNGSTANVSIQTNKGTLSMSGSDFKTIFNLRAPGFISIRSPLYNIERK